MSADHRLSFVPHPTAANTWWPAIFYESVQEAYDERYSKDEFMLKRMLSMQLIQERTSKVPLPLAELLGANEWKTACTLEERKDFYDSLPDVMEENTEERLGSELYRKWHSALDHVSEIMALVMRSHNPSAMIVDAEEENIAPRNTTTRAVVSERKKPAAPRPAAPRRKTLIKKRKNDQGRIWGRETTKRVKTTFVATTSKSDNFYVFKILWGHLKADGWVAKKSTNPLNDWNYLRPGVTSLKTAVLGQDYFCDGEDVIEYARKNDYRRLILGDAADEVEEAPEPPAPAQNPVPRRFVKRLRKAGWALQPSYKCATGTDDGSYWWVKPEFVQSVNDVKGRDYFATPGDVLDWINRTGYQLPEEERGTADDDGDSTMTQIEDDSSAAAIHAETTPTSNPTRPQNPGAPRLSVTSSSPYDDHDRFEWPVLWPHLKRFGWKYCKAGKFNKLHDYYYVRPNKTVENGVVGKDYFLCEADVVAYEKEKEGVVDIVVERPTISNTRRITLSPSTTKKPLVVVKKKKKTKRVKKPPVIAVVKKPAFVRTEWWQEEAIPPFIGRHGGIWRLLQDKLGFRYSVGEYHLPKNASPAASFINDHDLRAHLCVHGIPNYDASKFEEDERTDLIRWVTFAHVAVKETTSVKILQDVPIPSTEQALELLAQIHFQDLGTGSYYHSSTDQTFDSLEDVRSHVRGMPELVVVEGRRRAKDKTLGEKQVLILRLWAALSTAPIPVFGGGSQKIVLHGEKDT